MKVIGNAPQEYVDAAIYYASRLLDGRTSRHVEIEIVLDDTFAYAGCCINEDEFGLKPKFFRIELNPSAHDHALQALAHEMVHVAQYATGRLSDGNSGVIYWCSEKFTAVDSLNYGSWDEYPWEKEAYSLEEELFEEWLSEEIE